MCDKSSSAITCIAKTMYTLVRSFLEDTVQHKALSPRCIDTMVRDTATIACYVVSQSSFNNRTTAATLEKDDSPSTYSKAHNAHNSASVTPI